MAEVAAPAAPNAPASGATPAAPHFEDSPTVRDGAPPDSVVRLARPIKPIPRLPGVFSDDDGFAPSLDADATASAAAPHRGPDGRFVATSSATAPGSGEHTLEPTSQPTPADADSGPFEFAGERFATRAAAEQNFRSLRGNFKTIQSLGKSLGGVEKIVPQFQSAAESARGWKAEAEHWRAVAEQRSSGQPAAAVAAKPQSPSTAPNDADAEAAEAEMWAMYAEIKKLATDRGEPHKAEQWLISEVRKQDQSRLQRLLDERDAPLKAQQEKEAVLKQTNTLWEALADYTLEDGSAAFPELHDPEAAYKVGQIWASLGLPRASALTHQGAIAAIGMYRMTTPNGSQARTAPPAPPVAAPRQPQQPTDAQAAAALTDGRPMVASVGGNGTQSAEAQRILAGLRSTHSPNRAVLGFDA